MKKQHNTCSLGKIKELQRLFSEFKISLFIFLLTAFNLSAARAALPGDSGLPDIYINRGSFAELSQDASPQRQVRGQIKDASNGEAMPGVNIRIEGTSLGTASDVIGGFTIEVPGPDAVLIFSFVGYNQQSITVGNQEVINVELLPDVSILNEVVVVGYNSQQRLDISGSISVVDVSKATVGPSQQIGKQLQGRAAGVTIFTTGQPGAAPTIRIRGVNTFGDNNPLYIVDGIPTQDVNTLNPSDIESIQILKDAAAASIYGSRASNGVIIITTKKGKTGVRVEYNVIGGYTVPDVDNVFNILNPIEMAKLKWMAIENGGGNPRPDPLYGNGAEPRLPDYIRPLGAMAGEVDENDYYLLPEYTGGASQLSTFNQITRANKEGTDWYKEIHRNAYSLNNNLSISGGGETGKFFISFNNLDQQGAVIETYNKRTTFRVNTLFNVSDKFRIGENLTGLSNVNPTISSSQTSAIGYSFTQQPIIPVYDIAGNFAGPAGIGSGSNPVAVQLRSRNNRTDNYRMFGNAFAELDFLNYFTVRTSIGGDFSASDTRDFVYPTYERAENIVSSTHSRSSAFNKNYIWTNTLIFKKVFADLHSVNLLLGSEIYKSQGESLGGSTQDYFSFNPDYVNLTTGSGIKTNYSSSYANSLASFFGRLDYVFNSKYILGVTLRRDGSSRFIGENRWGWFPAASAAWRISKENFMQGLPWLSDLKIRGSYGILGNQLGISTDNPYTTFSGNTGNSYYAIDGSNNAIQLGFRQARVGNPDAKWEKNINGTIGIDAYLFDYKLGIMVEYYWKDTKDLLYNVTLPGTMGMASAPYMNVAHVKNRGFDASVENSGTIIGDLKYEATLTFTAYKNEIAYIADNIDYFGGSTDYNALGYPMNSFYGYKIQGFWQSDEEIAAANALTGKTYQTDMKVGRYRFVDVNNDSQITAADRTILGDPHPDFTYGLNLTLTYRNFDLNTFFYGSQGNEIYASYLRYLDFYTFLEGGKSYNCLYNSWTPENRNAKLPIQENVTSFSTTGFDNDYLVKKGSFLKLKDLTLGYTLPERVTSSIRASSLRAFIQASNILTLTNYEGRDPEVFGSDEATYINHPMYQLGINVAF
jgi:TonB-dependent starch-binding outer membrane protein SusC